MLTREQLTANIEALEKQGASQQDIQGYLDSQKGQGSVQSQPQQETITQSNPLAGNQNNTIADYNPETDAQGSIIGSGLKAGGKALVNTIPSAINAGVDLVKAGVNVFNPNMEKNTLANIGRIGLGGIQKLIPGQQGNEENFDALIGAFKNRYGSLSAATNTAVEDPFGFGSDVAALFTGGASLLGKGAKVANVIDKVGDVTRATRANDFFANAMQKSAINLTKNQRVTFADKLTETAEYLNKTKAIGTPEMKFNKVQKEINTKFEPTIQKTLERNKDVVADTKSVQDSLKSLKEGYFDDSDFPLISRRIDEFADGLDRYEKGIPVKALNSLKRSTFKNAFNNAGEKVTDALEFALADKLYENLSKVLKDKGINFNGVDINTFNGQYQKAINAQKILNIARKRPFAGLVSRLSAAGLAAFIGNMFGGPVAAVGASAVSGGAASAIGAATNIAKGAAAKAISTGSKNAPLVTPSIISGSNALDSAQDSQEINQF